MADDTVRSLALLAAAKALHLACEDLTLAAQFFRTAGFDTTADQAVSAAASLFDLAHDIWPDYPEESK